MIDIQGATGSIKSLPPKRKEEAEGQLMTVDVEPTLDLFVTPQQYDGFYDNAQAGATPSVFFWRVPATDAKDQTRYLRWFTFKKITVEVPKKLEHMLKLVTKKLNEETDEAYKKSRIEVVLPCFPQSCSAELSSNFARLTLKVRGHVAPGDHAKLLDLFRRENLDVSFYQRQGDLVQQDTAVPRLKVEEKPTAPTPPAAPSSDDKMFPKLIEFVAAMRVEEGETFITLPEVTKKLRIGINRAMILLAAAVKDGHLLEKTDAGEYLFPLVIPDSTPAATERTEGKESTPQPGGTAQPEATASAQSPEGDVHPASGQPRTPKCVHEWDGDQWIDNAGVRVEPQPDPPKFVNVNQPPDDGEAPASNDELE